MPTRLAVQMYTLREFTKTAADLATSLKRVADMGYAGVQMSAVGCMNGETPEVTAAMARKMLDDNGLVCCATHRGWDALRDRTDAEIEFHQTLGCNFTAIGGIPSAMHEEGEPGYRRFLVEAKPVIARLAAEGIRFGYHNHAHEFVRYAIGPKTLYDIFVDDGAAIDLCLELDTFWAVHGGLNPVRIFERAYGRVPVIHVKDKEVHIKQGPRMSACGEGNLDWASILPACRAAGVEWYAVEQDDCFGRDPFDCLKSSFDFLRSRGV